MKTSTAASATPGITAQASSLARRDEDDGVALAPELGDDGDLLTERMIATWAIAQHATAIQKIASASRKGMTDGL